MKTLQPPGRVPQIVQHSPRRAALLRRVLTAIYRAILRLEVECEERIPGEGPCIVVLNHLSNFDAHLLYLLYTLVQRLDATGLVAAAYRRRPFFRWMVEACGGMWLRLGEGDRRALRTALQLLANGWLVGLSPEGGRSPTGALSQGRRGAAFLALRSGGPVLPLAVTGTERIHGNLLRLRRTRVRVRVGEAFHPAGGRELDFRTRTQRATEEIMCRIAALLPPPYRGEYADHPLLAALVRAQAR